ncbi:cytochrome c oxidase subunit II [Sphingomonas sp. CBMAI 2297]|uniref:cytochrome c oxidase subunit II n=1 Tax=Sphingomonas sp. CBMAI 2297 TaxID=2991720 RepID=UPI0024554D3B|nr:cytochrome c oxidase subunit II [Sphingomonas sp. CBMAI 2297]MDH4745454.1 cytochrome c oxidase subunit II [Sphingomonas sp. CBMAI 2297]
MRMLGLTSILLAAGMAFATPASAQEPVANSATPVANSAAPAATATPAVADPTLDASGQPRTKAAPGIGQPTADAITLQEQVTPNGREAHRFHNYILLPLITAISIFVLLLLVWVIFRYRRAANPTPSRTAHNTTIEIIWTLVPVLILVAIAVPSISLLAAQFKPAPKDAITLKAIGNQWFWSYEYPDNGGIQLTANMLKEQSQVPAGTRYRTDADGPRLLATDQRVVLPVGVPIRLITTAQDVIHSWAVPAFWIKLDAVPGKLNETSFTIDKPGLYFGQCSELCGARHAYMPIAVEAVSPAEFAQWVKSKGGTMPAEVAAAAAATATATQNAAAPAAETNAAAEPAATNETAPAANAAAGNMTGK